MAVLQSTFDELQDDITGLYNDWFIETCSEWAIPYIADLLGLTGIEPSTDGQFSQRAFVANTLYYRARKGTVPIIERIARDLADEPAKATEYFRRLAVTQQMRHIQTKRLGTALIRSSWPAHLAHTAFETAPHLAEARRIAAGRGRYNIPNVGLDLWRAKSFFIERATPREVAPGNYTFDPTGRQVPLFNRARSETDFVVMHSDVPEPLAWRPLYDELANRRSGVLEDEDGVYFGTQPVLQLFVDGEPVAPEDIYIASLEPWRQPTRGVAIDVERGRLALSPEVEGEVSVSYAHGWPGEVGAMPYDRRRLITSSAVQASRMVIVPSPTIPDVATAIQLWDADDDETLLIRVSGSATFEGDLVIDKPRGTLRIEAENGQRPVIIGAIRIPSSSGLVKLEMEGILIDGSIRVRNQLERLSLAACTFDIRLVPSIVVDESNLVLELSLERCVAGGLQLPRDMAGVIIRDSIIDGDRCGFALRRSPATATTDYAPRATIERSTIVGAVSIKEGTLLSESIFTEPVHCERVQTGCTRYSFVPFGSRVPRRFHCQPFDRYQTLRREMEAELGRALTPEEDDQIASRATRETTPRFVTRDPRSEGFLLLHPHGPCAICKGAEDEGEMGAWHTLYEQRRLRHLNGAIGDYVRFGLEAGIFPATRH